MSADPNPPAFALANAALLVFAAVLDLAPYAAYEALRLIRGRLSGSLPSGASGA